MPDGFLAFLNLCGPWILLAIGIGCLPLSTVLHPGYLKFTRWEWSSRGPLGRVSGAMLDRAWLKQVQARLRSTKPTWERMVASVIFCLALIAAGTIWLYLRRPAPG